MAEDAVIDVRMFAAPDVELGSTDVRADDLRNHVPIVWCG